MKIQDSITGNTYEVTYQEFCDIMEKKRKRDRIKKAICEAVDKLKPGKSLSFTVSSKIIEE